MELDILDALDEIRSLNAKTSKIDPEDVLHRIEAERKRKAEAQANNITDPDELKALEALTEQKVKDAIKRLDDDAKNDDSDDEDFLDPFHPDLFRPFKSEKADSALTDDDGFTIPKPIKVRKTNKKGESGIISVGMGSDKQIRLKFKPRFREDAVLKEPRIDEPEVSPIQSGSTMNSGGLAVDGADVDDNVVVESGGFSLVNY
jgi:hypothetical protein